MLPSYELTVEERVANGAQLLDERIPGWYRRINPETLSIANSARCICGQLSVEGDWDPVMNWLSGTTWGQDHVAWAEFASRNGFTGESCTEEWLVAIQARLDHDLLKTSEIVVA